MDNNVRSFSRSLKARTTDSTTRMNSNYRIFAAIIIGFLAVTSIINMMYHQKFAKETDSVHRKSVDIFKSDISHNHGIRNANGNKGKSPVLVKEGLKKSLSKKRVYAVVASKYLPSDTDEISLPRLEPHPEIFNNNLDEKNIDTDRVDDKPPTDTDDSSIDSKDGKVSVDANGTIAKSPALKADTNSRSELAGLTCVKYGGPSDESASEMVYWSDIPSDSSYVSPLKNKALQYMTFEPDGGGWNNIRMAMETVIVMAHAMGRTLVIPPGQKMYLLGKDRNKQNIHFSFADFFHLHSIDMEHAGFDIITHEEFLLREAMTGNLKNKTSGQVSFPPYNRTNWDGQDPTEYKEWLREVTLTPLWKPSKCIASFPASDGSQGIDRLNTMLETIIREREEQVLEEPLPVDSEPVDRMQEMRAGRSELCLYDEEMQNAPILHFMCYHKMRVRLLVHFYAFIFFEDWKQQLWTNRFVRDHLRYIDELQCGAARVVEALREKSKENGNPEGIFDSFHVRRGDFQYKGTRIEATELYKNSADLIPENATLYIATDERNKKFFDPIKQHYHVYFLDDFKHLFEKMNTNYYGMLDQLIASRGRTFVGTFHSTFTGYINRMRGYHSQKQKLEGYKFGAIKSYYFTPAAKKHAMRTYAKVKGPFFAREFPVSWLDIDKGIGYL